MDYKEYHLDTTGEAKLRLYVRNSDAVRVKSNISHDKFPGSKGSVRQDATILICPGGGYALLSEREMEPVAMRFQNMGYRVAVLLYSVGKSAQNGQPLLDAARAVRLIRERTSEWDICRNKVILCGFSAGGHVAAGLGVNWKSDFLIKELGGDVQDFRPDALILAYPFILLEEVNRHQPYIPNFSMANSNIGEEEYVYLEKGEKFIDLKKLFLSYLFGKVNVSVEEENSVSLEDKVNPTTPPAFLWHTSMDNLVWASNSVRFALALEKNKVPYELHVFASGYHGISLADVTTAGGEATAIVPECQCWPELMDKWLHKLLCNT